MKTGIKILFTVGGIFLWGLSQIFLKVARGDSLTAGPLGTIITIGIIVGLIAVWKSGKNKNIVKYQNKDDIELKKD